MVGENKEDGEFQYPTKEDIDKFRFYIANWKSASVHCEEVLALYGENPSYLLIPLTYELIRSNQDNLQLQNKIGKLTIGLFAVALVALISPFYLLFKEFTQDYTIFGIFIPSGVTALLLAIALTCLIEAFVLRALYPQK
jgi:hypothetical protein